MLLVKCYHNSRKAEEIRIRETEETVTLANGEIAQLYAVSKPEKYSAKIRVPHIESWGWRKLLLTCLSSMEYQDQWERENEDKNVV